MQRLLFLFVMVLWFSSCKPGVLYEAYPPVYYTGDDPVWAGRNYNDSGWSAERGNTGDRVFWTRLRVQLIKNMGGPVGLQVEAFGAFEVYWDGVLIGNNGLISQKGVPEIPGTETSYFLVPDLLSQTGVHIIALRASQSYLGHVQRSTSVKLENHTRLLRMPLIIISFMNLMAGAFLIAAIYYFFLYMNSRYKEYTILIFAVICSLFFTLLILEYVKFYIEIPYTAFFTRLEIIGWLTFVIAMLVPLYFTIQFHFSSKVLLLSVLFTVLLALYIINYGHYDLTARLYSVVMWIASLVIVLNAIFKKERGGGIVLAGLLASAIVNRYLVYDFSLFISFTLIVLCMLYLHTIRARTIEEEHQSSLLLSSRLRLELIKKNIQPHFLKNTLTSLIDWVEESPKEGAAFIHALAGEFDIMNAIAEATLIPVQQEIELCKTHLSVMQFRKELRYEWEESGIDAMEYIPPALIHTLLENGITHSMPLADGSVRFRLCYIRNRGYRQYTFETTALNRPLVQQREGGNGFRYIKARLTESYIDRWTFTSGPSAQGWLTTITIYNK
jgi:hypothetical protein